MILQWLYAEVAETALRMWTVCEMKPTFIAKEQQ